MSKLSPRKLENNTSAIITLPFTASYPHGFRLLPGLNTVPAQYYQELTEYEVVSQAKVVNGRKVPASSRKPGLQALERLQEAVNFPTANGDRYGPRLTVYPEGAALERDDGPVPPVSLPANKDVAKKLVELTTDRDALRRWAKNTRGEIQNLVEAKLNSLSGIKVGE